MWTIVSYFATLFSLRRSSAFAAKTRCWDSSCRPVFFSPHVHFGPWYTWYKRSNHVDTVDISFMLVRGVTTLFVLWLWYVGQVHKYVHPGPWYHHWKLFFFYFYFTLFGVSCRDNVFFGCFVLVWFVWRLLQKVLVATLAIQFGNVKFLRHNMIYKISTNQSKTFKPSHVESGAVSPALNMLISF